MPGKDSIISQASVRLINDLTDAKSMEDFNHILSRLGYEDLIIYEDYWSDTLPFGKILVIGDPAMSIDDMSGCFKSYGIMKDRVEYISFEAFKNYNIGRLEYSTDYRLILIGPVSHKAKGMGKVRSSISSLEDNPNITKVKRIQAKSSSNNLKITKSALKEAIEEEIESGYLEID